jgi:hypothetical protein
MIVVASVFASGSRDNRRTAGHVSHASKRARLPTCTVAIVHGINITIRNLQPRDSLATAAGAAWRRTMRAKCSAAQANPIGPGLQGATLQLCSLWSSSRDAEARVAHEVNGMGSPVLALP